MPESTMAQRISRAKRTVGRSGLDRLGDLRTVMRVLYLVFNEGYSGDVDLAAEAIRLTRQLSASVDDPEVDGLLALMLLHHARRRSRTRPDGGIVPLAQQDRTQWDTELIAEGVAIAQAALATRPARRIPGTSGDRRTPRRRPCRVSRRPTGCRSSSGTTSCSGSPTLRSCGSTVRSRSVRRTARTPGWRHWPRSRSTSAAATRSPPTSTRRTASWTRCPPLCRRSPQRTEPRRTRPSDTPGGATQPGAARAPLTGASRRQAVQVLCGDDSVLGGWSPRPSHTRAPSRRAIDSRCRGTFRVHRPEQNARSMSRHGAVRSLRPGLGVRRRFSPG